MIDLECQRQCLRHIWSIGIATHFDTTSLAFSESKQFYHSIYADAQYKPASTVHIVRCIQNQPNRRQTYSSNLSILKPT